MLKADRIIDHHCHGVSARDLDRPGLEALMSESHRPHVDGTTQFDKPLGLMIRRYCAPILDLEPHASPESYAGRRLALGAKEVNRRLLQATRMTAMLIDTGHRSDQIMDCDAMREASGSPAYEVVRIEAVMEEMARCAGSAGELIDLFDAEVETRSRRAIGLKSIVAYRTTFDIDQTRPERRAAEQAAGAWLAANATDGWRRLENEVLIRHALFRALDIASERGMPLQLHVGFGDQDISMPKCDPTVFTPFIKTAEARSVPITLLHCYPFVREAGWLAEVFSNVYYDVGVILNFVGPSAGRIMADALEMGPFHKQLYSSDAFGLAELHFLGRILYERALSSVLGRWIGDGDLTAKDADRIVAMISAGNAERIYRVSEFR